MNKGLLATLAIFLLIPIAFAANEAIITTNYVSIYETTSADIVLNVENNLSSASSINEVDVFTDGFNVNNIISFVDWSVLNNNSILFSTSTAAISPWGTQNFGFTLSANNVNADQVYNWTITTNDYDLGSDTNFLQFTILNDFTAPNITPLTPGFYNLGASELFSANASDAETGIDTGNVYLSTCDLVFDNVTNSSNLVYSQNSITCANGVCSDSIDLSSWTEGDVCYYFDVSNNGGETAVSNNLTTIIDRTAPAIILLSPIGNTFISAVTTDLTFTAQDNFDPDLECIINFGNTSILYNTSTINNTYNVAVTDGSYSWSVDCTDDVGLTGSSSTETFNVDTLGPNITITTPSVTDRGNDVVIDVTILDAGIGVDTLATVVEIIDPNNNVTIETITNDQITYTTTVNSVPGNYTVRITAYDNLGQVTVDSDTFRVRETYTLALTPTSTQIDASTTNNTLFVNLDGTIVRDDGTIPLGNVDITAIIANTTINITNGTFATSVEIPQSNGLFSILSTFFSGTDSFTGLATISVGPYCGNGIVDAGEECDGAPVLSCSDYGYSQGSTSCTALCTQDISSCSNPSSSGGGTGSGSHQRSTAPVIEEIIEEPGLSGGEVFFSEPEPIVEPETSGSSGIIEPPEEEPSGFGIGSAWAVLTNAVSSLNWLVVIGAITIGALLYIFGWKKKSKKDDSWNGYFNK